MVKKFLYITYTKKGPKWFCSFFLGTSSKSRCRTFNEGQTNVPLLQDSRSKLMIIGQYLVNRLYRPNKQYPPYCNKGQEICLDFTLISSFFLTKKREIHTHMIASTMTKLTVSMIVIVEPGLYLVRHDIKYILPYVSD